MRRALNQRLVRRAAALVLVFLAAPPLAGAREPWIVLQDCHYAPNDSNDGDSFHVLAGGKEYIFRLYFVDAPETDESFPERVNEQAKYFGLTSPQTTQLGEIADKFTKEELSRGFTVRTCLQDALGRSKKERFYAFIETSDGDLSELLVANGMARVHGSGAAPVGLNSPDREWRKLQRLEAEAKQQKVGGWGAAAGRMSARLPKQPGKHGPDSFDAFFHPERLAAPSEAEEILAAAKPTPMPLPLSNPKPLPFASAAPAGTALAGAKLDPNTASAGELINVPGIGPVMASRIIAARPFKTPDELRHVKGIGPKKYAQMRSYFIKEPEEGKTDH